LNKAGITSSSKGKKPARRANNITPQLQASISVPQYFL